LKTAQAIKEIAINTLQTEADSILNLKKFIEEDFVKSVEAIFQSKGRVIVTGIGKSAIIGQKLVATFNSTGTPAGFMHAADAIHGDLGTISSEDIVICISKSGNTPEIRVLVPLLKQGGNLLIAMVGNTDSFLSSHADFVLNTFVEKEACPNNLAPTSSTTSQLAMGDALAVCLLVCREFSKNDFAKFHPGGALGKKLYLRVGDICGQNAQPIVEWNAAIKNVIVEISSKRLGATAVVKDQKLIGIITDGDLRRMLEKSDHISNLIASDIMNAHPKSIEASELAVNALETLQANNISQLIVMSEGKYAGFIHLHDLLKEGIL
jgi:arabinose-5-phosphate isomerase